MQVTKGKNSCGISGQQKVERGLRRNVRSALRQGNAAFFLPLASERSCYSWFSRITMIRFSRSSVCAAECAAFSTDRRSMDWQARRMPVQQEIS